MAAIPLDVRSREQPKQTNRTKYTKHICILYGLFEKRDKTLGCGGATLQKEVKKGAAGATEAMPLAVRPTGTTATNQQQRKTLK